MPSCDKDFYVKFAKLSGFVACLSAFVWQVSTVYGLYASDTTVIGTTYVETGDKKLPSITFCPSNMKRMPAFVSNRTTYDLLSYKPVS
jgi:hypothetical protein